MDYLIIIFAAVIGFSSFLLSMVAKQVFQSVKRIKTSGKSLAIHILVLCCIVATTIGFAVDGWMTLDQIAEQRQVTAAAKPSLAVDHFPSLEEVQIPIGVGDFERARTETEILLFNHPDSALAWAWHGLASYRMGEFDSAQISWSKSYELDPDPVYLINLAAAEIKRNTHNSFRKALNLLLKAQDSPGNEIKLWYNLGIAHLYLGNYDSAGAYLDSVLEADVTHQAAYHNRELLYEFGY